MDQTQATLLLKNLGLPGEPLEEAYSNSNAVWMSQTHVVRAHIVGPSGRIQHEASVARRLSAEALYPPIVAVGWQGDHDWMVQERVPGQPLSSVWPTLKEAERRLAIGQLGLALRAIHRTDAADLSPPCQFGGAPVIPRREVAHHAVQVFQKMCRDQTVANAAGVLVKSLAQVIDDDPDTIIHGDLTPNNVIWDGKATAVIDLEMARREAPDVDLFNFISFCANPVRAVSEELEPVTRLEDYRDAPHWLRDTYPELFQHSMLRQRLQLYELISLAVGLQHALRGIRQQSEQKLAAVVQGRSDVAALGW